MVEGCGETSCARRARASHERAGEGAMVVIMVGRNQRGTTEYVKIVIEETPPSRMASFLRYRLSSSIF